MATVGIDDTLTPGDAKKVMGETAGGNERRPLVGSSTESPALRGGCHL
ncbi:hypothetical protein GBAR_LOCUS28190 [Geodia barretti]|uniref:Uncharacterized protein n=1 Tax=Geodia barretti TaxID=519541 RepID=A0AA35XGJ0_GEOBA|nr:hypothetical protein GBAR_LOCUS28190 [Geodia barretti]